MTTNTPRTCWCDQPATNLQDSDSILFQNGMPVCDEHFEGDEHEDRII